MDVWGACRQLEKIPSQSPSLPTCERKVLDITYLEAVDVFFVFCLDSDSNKIELHFQTLGLERARMDESLDLSSYPSLPPPPQLTSAPFLKNRIWGRGANIRCTYMCT